jgi:uncharacterized membrane protein YedE/YeeE
MNDNLFYSLLGGLIIGLAVSFMLLLNGRVTGISGIISGVLERQKGEAAWRYLFLLGMILGGFLIQFIEPALLNNSTDISFTKVILAGLLVGYGTVLGSGCTSGHGVCGLSRFSTRSLVATITFITLGIITASISYYLKGTAQ